MVVRKVSGRTLRRTELNKASLLLAEDSFSKAKEEAQEKCAAGPIDKLEAARDPKEMWTVYRKMTHKNQVNSVLPLIQENKPHIFNEEEKCKVLQEALFYCSQQDSEESG